MAKSPPSPYNRIRLIPDLNTPQHIYQEWTEMEDHSKLSSIRSSADFFDITNKAPDVEELQVDAAQNASLLDSLLHEAKPRFEKLRTKVESVSKKIADCLIFYYGIPATSTVKNALKTTKKLRLQQALDNLDAASSAVLVSLGQFGVHTEFLANPKVPHPEHWQILTEMNEVLFQNVMKYIESLQAVFVLVDFEAVAKELMPNKEKEPSDPKQTSRVDDIQKIRQELRSLRTCADGLMRFRYDRTFPSEMAMSIQIALSALDHWKDAMNAMYEQFMELDTTSFSIYCTVKRSDFQKLYVTAWKYFEAAGRGAVAGTYPSKLYEYIIDFIRITSFCLQAFQALFSEQEGVMC